MKFSIVFSTVALLLTPCLAASQYCLGPIHPPSASQTAKPSIVTVSSAQETFLPGMNCSNYPKELEKRVVLTDCPVSYKDIVPRLFKPQPNRSLFSSQVGEQEIEFASVNEFSILQKSFIDTNYQATYGCECPLFWEFASQAMSSMASGDAHVLFPDTTSSTLEGPNLWIWNTWEFPQLKANPNVCRLWHHKLSGGKPQLAAARCNDAHCGGEAFGNLDLGDISSLLNGTGAW
ncbi:hypothetical protein MMC06_001779 [Schaereria dolodes]|nr:hypothetical protein [Schaereria dolodes]